MLAQDFNPKLIHEKLTEEGRFTMAYSSFTQILREAGRKLSPVRAVPSPADNRQVSPSRPQRQPGIIKTGIEPFPDPRKIAPKTLI